MSLKLPDGWTSKPLGELFEFKNGFNADKSMYGKGKKFINIMEVINKQSLYEKDIPGQVDIPDDSFSLYSVIRGDVLFNRTSETPEEIGLTAVYLDNKPVTFGGFVIRARPIGKELDQEFCKYCFSASSVRKEIIKRGQGAIRANIGQGDLSDVYLQIPSKNEQEKIAKILSAWDEAIEKLENLIRCKQQRKSFLINSLLAGEKRFPNFDFSQSKDAKNTGWKKVKLSDNTEKIGSGKTPRGGDSVYSKSGTLFIRSQNVYPNQLLLNDCAYISEEIDSSMKNSRVQKMDVLLNITGASIGRCCVYKEEVRANVNQHVCIIRPTKSINPDYLCYFLNSDLGQKQIKSFLTKGNREGLNFQQIGSFEILIPPNVAEQDKIAQCLLNFDSEIDLFCKVKLKLQMQKQALMQQLLTGKKRVKL